MRILKSYDNSRIYYYINQKAVVGARERETLQPTDLPNKIQARYLIDRAWYPFSWSLQVYGMMICDSTTCLGILQPQQAAFSSIRTQFRLHITTWIRRPYAWRLGIMRSSLGILHDEEASPKRRSLTRPKKNLCRLRNTFGTSSSTSQQLQTLQKQCDIESRLVWIIAASALSTITVAVRLASRRNEITPSNPTRRGKKPKRMAAYTPKERALWSPRFAWHSYFLTPAAIDSADAI